MCCPGCVAARHAQFQRAQLVSIPVLLAIGIAIDWVTDSGGGNLWLFAGLVSLFGVLVVPFHELGHAIAAWLLHLRVFWICIGSCGRIVGAIRILGLDVVVRSIPVGGNTLIVAPVFIG